MQKKMPENFHIFSRFLTGRRVLHLTYITRSTEKTNNIKSPKTQVTFIFYFYFYCLYELRRNSLRPIVSYRQCKPTSHAGTESLQATCRSHDARRDAVVASRDAIFVIVHTRHTRGDIRPARPCPTVQHHGSRVRRRGPTELFIDSTR